jgi:hypothetical protein
MYMHLKSLVPRLPAFDVACKSLKGGRVREGLGARLRAPHWQKYIYMYIAIESDHLS